MPGTQYNLSSCFIIWIKNRAAAAKAPVSMIAYDQGSVVPNARGQKIRRKKNRIFESLKDILHYGSGFRGIIIVAVIVIIPGFFRVEPVKNKACDRCLDFTQLFYAFPEHFICCFSSPGYNNQSVNMFA